MTSQFKHESVLLQAVCDAFVSSTDALYLDLTAGGGGHADALLQQNGKMKAILLDRDYDAVTHLEAKFKNRNRVAVVDSKASELDKVLFLMQIQSVDFILADLGVSSHQFDTAERGFSFRMDGPFDMRMEATLQKRALDYVQELTVQELKDVLSKYGEERESLTVAKALKKAAAAGADTTEAFHDAIIAAKRFKKGRINPATKTFQALRMLVNDEEGELKAMLDKGFALLSDGGKMGIITFHSFEDRIVKQFFSDRRQGLPLMFNEGYVTYDRVVIPKAAKPGSEEVQINPRSRSAKLRIIQKYI